MKQRSTQCTLAGMGAQHVPCSCFFHLQLLPLWVIGPQRRIRLERACESPKKADLIPRGSEWLDLGLPAAEPRGNDTCALALSGYVFPAKGRAGSQREDQGGTLEHGVWCRVQRMARGDS